MLFSRILAAGLLVGACLADHEGVADDPPRMRPSLPTAEMIRAAEGQVKTSFAKEYPIERRAAFAATLLEYGLQPHSDRTVQYVLLRDARDFAAEAGAVKTALAAVDAMSGLFEFDPLKERAVVLDRALKTTRTVSVSQTIAGEAMRILEQAIETDELQTAADWSVLASSAAEEAKDTGLVKYLGTIRQDLASRRKEQRVFREASAVLTQKPEDADANQKRGLYLCLRRNDWKAGLTHLAKSGDKDIQQLASLEASAPDSPEQQIQLADAWWNFQAVAKDGSVAITFTHDPLDQSVSLSVQNRSSRMLQTAKATVPEDQPVYVAVCIAVRHPGDEANATIRVTPGR